MLIIAMLLLASTAYAQPKSAVELHRDMLMQECLSIQQEKQQCYFSQAQNAARVQELQERVKELESKLDALDQYWRERK